MKQAHPADHPVITLRYHKGELIIKEGDYGISIYKIKKGSVSIFTERDDKEIALATLKPGSLLGEFVFLTKGGERRTASARALEETELEVWHPSALSKEYMEMPPMLKYVADQLLTRLQRMNHVLIRLTEQVDRKQKAIEKSNSFPSRRYYYRKSVNLACWYWPVGVGTKARLQGRIKDISMTGLGMEIPVQNTSGVSHVAGDTLALTFTLTNGNDIELIAEIISIRQSDAAGGLQIGMSIKELSDHARKLLGFYMMPE